MIQKAELKQLQSQINPHFLYNSFFILKRRIKTGDNESAMYFAEKMGNYFRFITRSASDEVPLKQEVEHAGIFAEIQGMRFSNRIKVNFDELPQRYENVIVPRLILQPLIENAFVHGLEDLEENGLLDVRFKEEAGLLRIIVEDNGQNMPEDYIENINKALETRTDNTEMTGMFNIHRRLRLKFGGESGLKLTRGELGGLKVSVNIVYSEENSMEVAGYV
jgi:two-component system sensor histidine kinase YesM